MTSHLRPLLTPLDVNDLLYICNNRDECLKKAAEPTHDDYISIIIIVLKIILIMDLFIVHLAVQNSVYYLNCI